MLRRCCVFLLQSPHWRPQAPGLSMVDPFVNSDWKPERLKNDYEFVIGDLGLVSRVAGVISAKQLENATEIIENRIDKYRLPVRLKRRNIGEMQPVSKMSILSRLKPEIRQRYSGKNGNHAFDVFCVSAGTPILELEKMPHADYPASTKTLVELLYHGMHQLGVTCFVQEKGMVSGLDDSDRKSSFWGGTTYFSRPETAAPETMGMLYRANGTYQIGSPVPSPRKSIRHGRAQFEVEEDEHRAREYYAKTKSRALDHAVYPRDVLPKHKWRHKWVGQARVKGNPKRSLIHSWNGKPKRQKNRHG